MLAEKGIGRQLATSITSVVDGVDGPLRHQCVPE
jgi:hypothetical protein